MLKCFNSAAFEEIEAMESFIALEMFLDKGDIIRVTKDCLSWGGVVKMKNANKEALIRDYERIRELELEGLFVV